MRRFQVRPSWQLVSESEVQARKMEGESRQNGTEENEHDKIHQPIRAGRSRPSSAPYFGRLRTG